MRFSFTTPALFLFSGTVLSAGPLIFLEAPTLETLADSTLSYRVAPLPGQNTALDSCRLYGARVPAGGQAAGHARLDSIQTTVTTAQPASLRITVSPAWGRVGAQLALGVHYLVVACPDGSASPEFPLRVVTTRAPTLLSPRAEETSARPEISWTPVPGVPAYHILLSDQPLQIDVNAGTVSGASIIWQAIVPSSTSGILYGDPDPSGNFSRVDPPPLASGIEYNLVVLNNYDGRSALHTSVRAQALKLFTLRPPPDPLPPARMLEPLRGAAFRAPNDSLIRFRWTTSRASGRSANTYRLYVYAVESQQGVEVLRPVWQTEGTDTVAALPARGTLLNGRYVHKVFAMAEDGSGTVGDTASLTYSAETQTMRLGVRARGVSGDTTRLANARISVTALDGAGESLPLYSLSTGLLDREFGLGQYRFSVTLEGYDPVSQELALPGGSPVEFDPLLSPSPGKITGLISDTLNQPLGNTLITAEGSEGSPSEAQSDAAGRFLLGLREGLMRLTLRKNDYESRDTVFTVEQGRTHDLGRIQLRKAAGLLSGIVATPAGTPVASATAEIRDSAGTLLRQTLTDAQGGFRVFMTRGFYRVSALRAGYSGVEQTVQLRGTVVEVRITLTPGASVAKGRVLQITRLASGEVAAPREFAQVSLRPVSGSGISTATTADVNGGYSLSVADTGDFWLRASHPETYPDSQRIRITQPKSTVETELRLLRLASISGRIRLQPDTTVDPTQVLVSLLPLSGGTAVATIRAQGASEDPRGRLAFNLDGAPLGSYRLVGGLYGFAPGSEPVLTVSRGLRLDTSLILNRTVSRVAFHFSRGGTTLTGTVRLRAPYTSVFPSDSAQPLGAGTFVLDASPSDSTLLPLRGYTVGLTGSDSTVNLDFSAFQDPSAAKLAVGFLELPYRLDGPANSGHVAYSSRAGVWDTTRIPSTRLSGFDSIALPLPPRGGVLEYAFSFRSGVSVFSSAPEVRRIPVPKDSGLGDLSVSEGDSVVLPANGRGQLTVRALSAAGDALDDKVVQSGQIAYRLSAGFVGTVEVRQGLTFFLRAGNPPAASAKTGTGAAVWDTLHVTVTYQGRSQNLAAPIRVARLTAHRLRLASPWGDVPLLPAPLAVPLRVTAFDTSTAPPTPLLVDPEFRLDPPEAGAVRDGQLVLDTAFIGTVRVHARHIRLDGVTLQSELSEDRDPLLRGINVGQPLAPGAGSRLFFHNSGVELLCPAGAFPEGAQLRLFRRPMARTFASLKSSSLEGAAYEVFNPQAAPMAQPLEIRLAPPASRPQGTLAIRRFEADQLRWHELQDTGSGAANRFGQPFAFARIDSLAGNYYGLFSTSRPLGLSVFEALPNPFSPRVTALRDGNAQPGTRIRFRPESDSAAAVTLSLRIYTESGETVRTLILNRTFPKTESEIYWDGLDDWGRTVRNGRYLLQASLTPPGGGRAKMIVKPVVVFR